MRVLIVTFFIVFFDQLTKLYVKGIKIPFLGIDFEGMPYQSSKNVFGNFFKITFIENPGMAFGLQIGGKLFLSLFTIFATILLFIFLYKNRNEGLLLRLSLAFILGGATGNLIDRVFYGKIYDYAPLFYGRVVDFLHFDFPNFTIFGKNIYSWPIFNIADVFVTLGFLLILVGYKKIFENDADKEEETQLLLTGEGFQESSEFETGLNSEDLLRHYEHKSPEFDINSEKEGNQNFPGSEEKDLHTEYINETPKENITPESEIEQTSEINSDEEKINPETQNNQPDIKSENTDTEDKKTD